MVNSDEATPVDSISPLGGLHLLLPADHLFSGCSASARLRDFNNVSADIADLWLPTTRVLGDLNNFTSDFRAAEGSDLLSSNASEIAAIEKEMVELDRSISQAQYSYERLRHDPDEAGLYAQFRESWHDYRDIVNRVLELSRRDRKAEAIDHLHDEFALGLQRGERCAGATDQAIGRQGPGRQRAGGGRLQAGLPG